MKEHPAEAAVRAWASLLRASHSLLARIEAELKQADLPPLVWYDALHELATAPEGGLRPFELEARMLLPQYNVSRLLAKMEEERVIERRAHPADKRGHVVAITGEGRRLRRRMWGVYGPAIARYVGAVLTDPEARALASLLTRLYPRGSTL